MLDCITTYAAPNKGTTILYWFRSPKIVLNPPVNGKIQGLFKAFECFSSTFQGKFNFQWLSRQSYIFRYFSSLWKPCIQWNTKGNNFIFLTLTKVWMPKVQFYVFDGHTSHSIGSVWVKVFRINPEFRILMLTFHWKSASKCWIREIIVASLIIFFRLSKHN